MAPMPQSARALRIALFGALLLGVSGYQSYNEVVSPTNTAAELHKMVAQLEWVEVAERKLHQKIEAVAEKESLSSVRSIEENSGLIRKISLSLKEQKAWRANRAAALHKEATTMSQLEEDLQGLKQRRQEAQKVFAVQEVKLMKTVNELQESIEALQKPLGRTPSAARLADVALKVRGALRNSGYSVLDAPQRELLEKFYDAAEDSKKSHWASSPLLDFFNREQFKNNELVRTLRFVIHETQSELEAVRGKEVTARGRYAQLEKELTASREASEKNMAEIKNEVAQSEERSSRELAQLVAAESSVKVTREELETVRKDLAQQVKNLKVRSRSRTSLIRILKEAIESARKGQMLKLVMEHHQRAQLWQPEGSEELNFLQLESEVEQADDAQLSELQQSSEAEAGKPLDEVKSTIRGMIGKLAGVQASGAQKAQWCDAEKVKSEKSLKEKTITVERAKAKINVVDAQLAQVTNSVQMLATDMADIKTAMRVGYGVRKEQELFNEKSVKMYQEQREFLQSRFLSFVGSRQTLRLAAKTLTKLIAKTNIAEKRASRTFKAIEKKAELRFSTLKTDLNYKRRAQAQLKLDRVQAVSDLSTFEKEKAALERYKTQLLSTCFDNGRAAEERQSRRKEQKRSLRRVLEYMSEA